MHACKNTTINLTKSNVNQMASKIHVTEVSCDDVFVRKKCLITCLSKKLVSTTTNMTILKRHFKQILQLKEPFFVC